MSKVNGFWRDDYGEQCVQQAFRSLVEVGTIAQ